MHAMNAIHTVRCVSAGILKSSCVVLLSKLPEHVCERVYLLVFELPERYSARVTRMWVDGFQSEEAHLQEACCPVLVYQEGSEVS